MILLLIQLVIIRNPFQFITFYFTNLHIFVRTLSIHHPYVLFMIIVLIYYFLDPYNKFTDFKTATKYLKYLNLNLLFQCSKIITFYSNLIFICLFH